jgi:hypothetical protein
MSLYPCSNNDFPVTVGGQVCWYLKRGRPLQQVLVVLWHHILPSVGAAGVRQIDLDNPVSRCRKAVGGTQASHQGRPLHNSLAACNEDGAGRSAADWSLLRI